MRVLLLHCDYLEFNVGKKALKQPEEISEKNKRLEECIVCFMSVEKLDEQDPDYVVSELLNVIGQMSEQVKTKNLVIYPYAHLSSDLASLTIAQKVLDDTFEKAQKEYTAIKAPFGWYKSFELKCKGHPLSELSRTIVPKSSESQDVSQALVAEEKIKSEFFILGDDGKLISLKDYNYPRDSNLKKFCEYEKAKSRAADKMPPHIELMRRLELVDYESASDPGNLRYYPKGRMIKALLETYVSEKIIDYGGVEVETPIMYDLNHPTLSKYLNRFPARQYLIDSDKKKYFLRFAACFGQFLMAHDATLSYKSLPLRLYELARYSFRREKSGELTGLRRLRAFTMPDVHALCTDQKQAMEEYKSRFKLCVETIEGIGLSMDDIEVGIRLTKKFWDENRDFVMYLVGEIGKPVLLEMWDERIFYFILKYEFNFLDSSGKASALSTDQIDVENGKTYDIKYVGSDGQQHNPIILHCSPSGAIERIIYALLEKAYMESEKGISPSLPAWLSPTQVRIIAVSDLYLDVADKLCEKLSKNSIRADLDDRNESMGKKIREAEREWIPYIVVLGEKEINSNTLTVRKRKDKQQASMSEQDLINEIRDVVCDKPFRKLPLPRNLSKRPIFVG